MLVHFSKLIGPVLKAPVVELTASEGQVSARAWLNGEVTVRQQVDGTEAWTIYLSTTLLRPLSDTGEADISVVDIGGAPHLALDANGVDVTLPGMEEFVPQAGVEDGILLMDGEILSTAVQYAGQYRSAKKTISDHTNMYVYDDNGRLGVAGSNMFMVATVTGEAMPELSDELRAIIADGSNNFRLIPWDALSVGKPTCIFVCKSGAVIKFEDGVEARIPWREAKTSAWHRLFPLLDVQGWHGTVEAGSFESKYRLAAAYSAVGTTPQVSAKGENVIIGLNGPKGNIEASVAATGEGEAVHRIGPANVPLRGIGDKVNLVIPRDRKMPADATGAGGMLFWGEQKIGDATVRLSLVVMLVNSRAATGE